MPKDRIYVITQGDSTRLIEAASVTKARAFAATAITGRLASQQDLVNLIAAGVEVEKTTEPVPVAAAPTVAPLKEAA